MYFECPYYDLIDGKLYIDVGNRRQTQLVQSFKNAPSFANSAEAEEWLKDNDHRGNVR